MAQEKKFYTKEMIMDVFRTLARSQGFYGRLIRSIEEAGEEGQEWLQSLEDQHFTSDLDLILFIEC